MSKITDEQIAAVAAEAGYSGEPAPMIVRDILEAALSAEVMILTPGEEAVEKMARAMCGRDLDGCVSECLAAERCVGTMPSAYMKDVRAALASLVKP